MLQPKIYVKNKWKVYDVEEIHFDINVVAYNDGVHFDYAEVDFDEVEFIYNTGYKDMNGNYIYTGDILEYQTIDKHYIKRYVVEKDEEAEFYYYLTLEGRYFVGRLHSMNYDYSIIGNIYENKELLKNE